jgi:hypothetical protein
MDFMNIEEFASIARIEPASSDKGDLLLSSMILHGMAAKTLDLLGGTRLVPLDSQDGQASEVYFAPRCAMGFEKDINRLGSILKRNFYPIAELAQGYAILLMDEGGENFAISTTSFDVYYLGELEEAVLTCLTGRKSHPVLPIRDYPQWHNVDVFPPQSPEVYWVDAPEWIEETRAEEK